VTHAGPSAHIAGFLLLVVTVTASQAATTARIEVSPGQRVTVDGYVASVRMLLEDICYRSGLSYLAYDAPDREATVRYVDMPLRELLKKLLRHESYSLGLHEHKPGKVEVTWLWVIGDHEQVGGNRNPLISAVRLRRLRVPGSFLKAAFGDGDRADHDQALNLLVDRISGDPEELHRFLATDSALIARSIQRFERAEKILVELRDRQRDPQVRTKLDEILEVLQQ